jgi:hypothetical protein
MKGRQKNGRAAKAHTEGKWENGDAFDNLLRPSGLRLKCTLTPMSEEAQSCHASRVGCNWRTALPITS